MHQIEKENLRKQYLSIRRNTPNEQLSAWSYRIREAILEFIDRQQIDTVMLYAAFRSEPETQPLLKKLLEKKVRVALPKSQKNGVMEAYIVSAIEELAPATFGILEPPADVFLSPNEQQLILVPGAVFGRDGSRIGYGGGFYDRYLSACSQAIKAGVCYEFALVDCVPTDEHDIKMDCFFTENGCVNKV